MSVVKQILTYTFSFCILFSPIVLHAQEETGTDDTTQQEKKRSYIGISIDYGKLLLIPSKAETKVEGGIDFTFKDKFKILGELGWGKLTPEAAIENGEYESNGIYYRAGLAYGGEILPKSFLYVGALYALSQFDEKGRVVIESEVYEGYDQSFERTGLTASWFEVLLVTEQEFRKNMFLGAKIRLRIQYNFPDETDPPVYAVPGYGRSYDQTIPAFNLFYKYILPF